MATATAKKWRMVRLPAELADKLDEIAARMLESHEKGRSELPGDYCERVPLHYVVQRAVEELEDHRARSRKSSRRSQPADDQLALLKHFN